ncbi:MAG: hypothetical protein ACI8Q3_002346 [Marinomonas primoryensis]
MDLIRTASLLDNATLGNIADDVEGQLEGILKKLGSFNNKVGKQHRDKVGEYAIKSSCAP